MFYLALRIFAVNPPHSNLPEATPTLLNLPAHSARLSITPVNPACG